MIEEGLWKILGFMLAVVLIFVAPTMATYERMDRITYNVVEEEVGRFVDGVRDTGTITKENYQQFLNVLGNTGLTYNITLEHYKKTYIPVNTGGMPTGKYEIVYDNYYSDVIDKSLEDGTLSNRYTMSVGDMFYLHLENKSPTKSQIINQLLLGVSRKYPVIVLRKGGMIRHESD